MRKHLNIPTLLALLAALLVAGCERGGDLTLSSETDEPLYRQGQQLSKQGRIQEALNAYLKLISKRDETAPESHLEAGLILLRHVKDPVAAYYHFQKYLELQPNARQAVYVRGLRETAKREFARTLAATPLESQAERQETQDQIDRLLRENDQLKAELAALHAGAESAPPIRTRATLDNTADGPVIRLSAPPPEPTPAAPEDSPITYAPVENPPIEVAPAPAPVPTRPALAPGTRAVPTKPSAANGRRHTVVKGDTLYSLAQKYYGNRSRWRDILNANGDLLPRQDSPLSLGMELRIP